MTKSEHKTLFEQALLGLGIQCKWIRIATSRHNSKVERQHRTDEQCFYWLVKMFSLEDDCRQLVCYQREFNDHIMTCLDMRSLEQVLADNRAVMW